MAKESSGKHSNEISPDQGLDHVMFSSGDDAEIQGS